MEEVAWGERKGERKRRRTRRRREVEFWFRMLELFPLFLFSHHPFGNAAWLSPAHWKQRSPIRHAHQLEFFAQNRFILKGGE